jgi:SAM-dependent methyltransferase
VIRSKIILKEKKISIHETSASYWDEIITTKGKQLRLDAWRKYMKWLYENLVKLWFEPRGSRVSLKTDLFEEACSRYPVLPSLGNRGIGFDYSLQMARNAKQKNGDCSMLVCDLRKLPFFSSTIEQILSPSSLDHFSLASEIDVVLVEIGRVLKPNGVLVISLDNPQNPIVWIRNHLPFPWLNRIGLVPYYVGPTCTATEAKEKVRKAGMEVTHCIAVSHVPRVPAIWLVMLAEALESTRMGDWLSKHFEKWEVLQRFPSSFLTGYYIAIRAVKCPS